MSILDVFQQVANVGASLDLIAKVARYLIGLTQRLPRGEPRDAVAMTLQEWEDVAGTLEPRISRDLETVPDSSLGMRAEALAYLAERYAGSARQEVSAVPLATRHSRVAMAGDRVVVSFGQSDETSALSREQLAVPLDDLSLEPLDLGLRRRREAMPLPLPTFKVTMLGDSGAGKTMFMAAMYARLRATPRGVSIKAVDDAVDLELDKVMRSFYEFKTWPPASDFDQKTYDFELRLRERPIARIDWVDYRGGAVTESDDEKGGSLLAQRLRASQAILWMVDMSKLGNGRVEGVRQQILTRVARMAHMCRQAVENHDEPRAWIFVRTKADEVREPNSSPNWERACDDLIRHLGETVQIALAGHYSRAAALPVSASGRLSPQGDESPLDDNPFFVEWPLILSLAFLLDVEFMKLKQQRGQALGDYQSARTGRLEDFVRSFLNLGQKPEQVQAWQTASTIGRQLIGMHKDIGDLLRDCPPVIKLLHERHGIV
jgi:hypothetical protein